MNDKLYKNLIIFSFLIFFVVLFFTVNRVYNKINSIKNSDKYLSYIDKDGISIRKKETLNEYQYLIDDYDNDLKYSWSFKKDDVTSESLEKSLNIEKDLKLKLDAITHDTDMINERVDQNKLIVSFDYHGLLPEDAKISINVQNKFKDKEKLYLYYYNPESDQIEFIDKDIEVKDGRASFTISHCSDYFLTAAVVNDAVNNPKKVNYVIITLIIIIFILIAMTMAQSKK